MSDFFDIFKIVFLLFSIMGAYARVCQNATSVTTAFFLPYHAMSLNVLDWNALKCA